MECPECGSEITGGSRYCNECGAKIEFPGERVYENKPEMLACPKCNRTILASSEQCPDCGHLFTPEEPETPDNWTREIEFLLWGLKIRHGSYDRFYEGSFSFLGNTQTNVYTKGRYVVEFGGGVTILTVLSLILLYLALTSYPPAILIALLALSVTALAGLFYYWLAAVPPKSYRRNKRTAPKDL